MKNAIYNLRKQKGFTQQQVAKMLNISQQAYQRYENCEIKTISTETLLKLTDILNTDISYLLGLDKDINQRPKNKMIANDFQQSSISTEEIKNEREKVINLAKQLSYFSCLEATAYLTRLIARDEQENRYWLDYKNYLEDISKTDESELTEQDKFNLKYKSLFNYIDNNQSGDKNE